MRELAATVVGAACCACVGGILGTELLNSGHLFHGVYPSPGPGLQWKELCGLLLQTWVLPFAFVLVGVFGFALLFLPGTYELDVPVPFYTCLLYTSDAADE